MFWNGNWIQDLGFRIPCQWKLDFIFQSLLGLRIPELNSVFQSPGFRIPPTKIFRIPVSGSITLPRLLFPPTTGGLSNDDGDGNENGKKAIGLDRQNNNFARASRVFLHFFAVAARLQRESA